MACLTYQTPAAVECCWSRWRRSRWSTPGAYRANVVTGWPASCGETSNASYGTPVDARRG